ncbi:MAG: hypothetical protein KKE53_11455 [Proteobacteria bacterium]|nr:hypothetical protein [Pseudomonadota bacterium]
MELTDTIAVCGVRFAGKDQGAKDEGFGFCSPPSLPHFAFDFRSGFSRQKAPGRIFLPGAFCVVCGFLSTQGRDDRCPPKVAVLEMQGNNLIFIHFPHTAYLKPHTAYLFTATRNPLTVSLTVYFFPTTTFAYQTKWFLWESIYNNFIPFKVF